MNADRAALLAKLKWAYPRGPTHVTQEEWRVVLDALAAPLDRETLARIIEAHTAEGWGSGPGSRGHYIPCRCGAATYGEAEGLRSAHAAHARHVADAVLARLEADRG